MAVCYADVRAMNKNAESTYQSYLLRLWRDSPHSPWRASLQSTTTEQIHQFANVAQMWAFLMAQLELDANGLEIDDTSLGKTTRS